MHRPTVGRLSVNYRSTRHSLMLLWFADLMNVTEEVTECAEVLFKYPLAACLFYQFYKFCLL